MVDVSGLTARQVRVAAEFLEPRAAHYAFVSTIAVYDERVLSSREPIPETAATLAGDPRDSSSHRLADYGTQKRGAELALEQIFGVDRRLIARPGVVLGPAENVRRISFWLPRCASGQDVIGPGGPDAALQIVDVSDLAEWIVAGAVARLSGTYNVVNDPGRDTWGEWLTACLSVTGGRGHVRWADDELLLSHGVTPNFGLPMWVPGGSPLFANDRVRATGFRGRPLGATAQSAWDWLRSVPSDRWDNRERYVPAVVPADVEHRILAALQSR